MVDGEWRFGRAGIGSCKLLNERVIHFVYVGCAGKLGGACAARRSRPLWKIQSDGTGNAEIAVSGFCFLFAFCAETMENFTTVSTVKLANQHLVTRRFGPITQIFVKIQEARKVFVWPLSKRRKLGVLLNST